MKEQRRAWFVASAIYLALMMNAADVYFVNNAYLAIENFLTQEVNQTFGLGQKKSALSFLWPCWVSVAWLGSATACLLVPLVCDSFGRKPSILLGLAGSTFGRLLQFISPYFWPLLIVGRFLSSMFADFLLVAAAVLLSELPSSKSRGRLAGATTGVAGAAGTLTATILGLPGILGSTNRWQWAYLLFAVIGFVPLPVAIWMKESPTFLAMRNKSEAEIVRSLEFYRSSADGLEAVLRDAAALQEEKQSLLRAFKKDKALKKTFKNVIALVVAAATVVALNRSYSFLMLLRSGQSERTAGFLIVFSFMWEMLMAGLCTFLVDSVGRRPLFLTSSWLTVASFLVMGVSQCLFGLLESSAFTWLFFFGFMGTETALSLALHPVFYVLIPELTPSKYRSQLKAFSYLLVCGVSIVTGMAVVLLLPVIGGICYLFVAMVIGTAAAHLQRALVETKGKDFFKIRQEIQNLHPSDQGSSYGSTHAA